MADAVIVMMLTPKVRVPTSKPANDDEMIISMASNGKTRARHRETNWGNKLTPELRIKRAHDDLLMLTSWNACCCDNSL
jgi:hypothetical protein